MTELTFQHLEIFKKSFEVPHLLMKISVLTPTKQSHRGSKRVLRWMNFLTFSQLTNLGKKNSSHITLRLNKEAYMLKYSIFRLECI